MVIIIAALVLVSAAFSVGVKRSLTEMQQEWAHTATQMQLDADRDRMITPILREVQLVETMVRGEPLTRWLDNPEDPALRKAALDYMNAYRKGLTDQSYFLAVAATGEYLYNDAAGDYLGRESRYYLNSERGDDAWFYASLEAERDMHMNVDFDRGLGVVKLWINHRVYNASGKVAGIAGTGFDLDDFLELYVPSVSNGFQSVLTNSQGVIQVSPRGWDIQFGVLGKAAGEQPVIFDEASTTQDRELLLALFARARDNGGEAIFGEVSSKGVTQLVGVTYLPFLDWFQVSRIDAARIFKSDANLKLSIALAAALLVAVILVYALLLHGFLKPFARLSNLARDPIPDPDEARARADGLSGEWRQIAEWVVQLLARWRRAESALGDARLELDRTLRTLERERVTDPDTGLLAEQPFMRALDQACALSRRTDLPVTLLVVRPGGALARGSDAWRESGDVVLHELASAVASSMSDSADTVGRLGDYEVAVVLPGTDAERAAEVLERLRRDLAFVEIALPGHARAVKLQVFAGVETAETASHASADRLRRRAEQALYIESVKDAE